MNTSNTQEQADKPRWVHTLSPPWTTEQYGVVQFLRAYPKCRWIVGSFAALVCLTPIISMVSSIFGFKIGIDYIPAILIGPGLIYLTTISGPQFEVVFPQRQAAQEREKAEKQFEETKTVEDALRVDFTRLNEYYTINQAQAQSSFRWAIFSMLLGFGTIISGIWIFYFHKTTPDTFMASLSAAAGIVVNIIGGVFLHLHSKIQDRALLYYQELSRLRRLSIAIRLAEAHEDQTEKQNARNLVIRELVALRALPQVEPPPGIGTLP